MKNPEIDIGPIRKGKKKKRRRTKSQDRLTVMIFKRVGKLKTFKISSLLILLASLFLLIYIVLTIFLTNKYLAYFYPIESIYPFRCVGIDKLQRNKIDELKRKLIKTTKTLERSKQHIALLDDYIRENKEQTPEPMSSVNYTESSLPKLVDISELKVERNKSTINVDFRIVNRQLNEGPIGGYIFVLASIKNSDKSEVWVYPSSPLKDGLPTNYRSGQRFFIQRFKSVSSKYTLSKSINKPLILEILVYDRNGKLILKKVVEA